MLHNLFTPIFQLIQLHYNQQKESWPATIAKIKMKREYLWQASMVESSTAGLNLRSTCSTSSSSPIQIPNGTSIVVETVSGQHAWFATSYGGHDGYVVAEYVAISTAMEVPALFLHLAARSISERLLPPPPLSCLRRRRIPLCGSLILIPSMVGSVFPAVKAQAGLLLTISPL